MGLVITDGTNNYPLPAGRPSIGSPPTRPQLPCDGCGEPKVRRKLFVVTFGLCALALPMLAAGQIKDDFEFWDQNNGAHQREATT